MTLFGGSKPRPGLPGVAPYFPSPEEQATAVPSRSPANMFGRAPTYQTPGIGDGLLERNGGSGGGVLSNAIMAALGQQSGMGSPGAPGGGASPRGQVLRDILNTQLPEQKVDTSSLTGVPMPKIKGPGFFNSGGLGEKLLKGFGEFALQYQASQGDQGAIMTLRGRMEQQAAQRRMMEDAKQRQTDRDEWTWRENYKREHPDDQFTQYLAAAGIDPRSQQGQAMYRQRAESMAAPPMMAIDGYDPQGNPIKTFMPRNGPTGGQPQASGPAPGTVRNGFRFNGGNPNDRASWVPVGGAPSVGGATFR